MKKKLLALLLGSTLVLAACGGGDNNNSNETGNNNQTNETPGVEETNNNNETAGAIDAEDVYLKRCSQCHGQNLEGGLGAELAEIGSKLSKDEILATIEEGTDDGMAPNLIVGDEADAVAEWLSEMK